MSASISPLLTTNSAGTDGSATSSPPAAPQSGVSVDENTFLTLLVAQLKNQDPLSPQDGTQFVSQLAQFSQLEQLIGINKNTASVAGVVAPPTSGSGGASAS